MNPTPRPSELSRDVAHAMNLFAHPVAGWAAASAVGMGLAAQMWGIWAGAVAGALERAGRMGDDAVRAGEEAQTVAALKARVAAVSLMEEAQSFARELADEAPAKAPRAPAAGIRSVRPAEKMAKPAKPDDLKRIAGIGPKLEQVLNGLGIWTFGQIAGWTDADVARVEEQLGLSGRIGRDGWVAEAKKLARPRRK